MIDVYGLKNCDTCRKAVKWLQANDVEHRFHDLRARGASAPEIARWAAGVGWETLLNKAGTTWRQLPENEKGDLDEARAVRLMAAHVALMKRPIFDIGATVVAGFKEKQKQAVLERAA